MDEFNVLYYIIIIYYIQWYYININYINFIKYLELIV